MDSMRRLHFGTNKHAEFTAHVHILDLLNVPLVEGECRIKWRFKGGITLNSTNNDKVMGQALQTSKSYLKDLRSSAGAAVGSISSTNAGPSSPRDSEERGGGGGSTSMTDAYGHHYNHHHHSHDDSNEQHHSLGERVKDAIFHPHRTLKASTSSHNNALSAHSTVSSSNQSSGSSPRSRSHTLPHTSTTTTSSSPSSPTVVAASSPSASSPHYISSPGGHTLRRDITPTDYFKLQGGGPGSATIGDKAEEASGNNAGTSSSSRRRPSASASASASEAGRRSFSPPPFPPSSPHSPRSQYYNNPLSPAVTLRAQDGANAGNAPRTPPASSTAAAAVRGYSSNMAGGGESSNGHHLTTPPSRSATRQMQSQSQSQSQSNGDRDRDRDYLKHTSSVQSRRHGSLGPSGASSDSPLSSSLSKTHATLYESLKCAGMPSKAEAKGKTSYTPLMNSTVRFDQHIICAVAIPMRKNTKQLEESVVKLKVSYKVRTTPIPERIGSRPASIASGNLNGIATTADEDGKGADAKSIASSIRSHKTRVNGANVSLLSPATSGSSTPMINAKEAHEEVHLGDLWLNLSEFVSAEMAEGFFTGQGKPRVKEAWITRRYLLQNGRTNALLRVAVKMDWLSGIRDFTAPPLTKGQIISPKKNSSRQLHGNGKDKEQDRESVYSAASGSGSRMYLQGDNISSRSFVSADYSTSGGQRPSSSYRAVSGTGRYGDSPESSDDGQGERRHHHHHHNRHQYESSDEVQAEVDLINEIFETEDTPPSTPPLTPEKSASWADESGFGSPFETITHSTADSLVPHEQQHHSRLHAFGSPAQKLAFLHRNKDKANKGKNSQKQATLGVADLDGRKRTHSAPSRAFSSPAGSVSRPSTPASGQADWFVHDDHNGSRPGRTSHEAIRPSRETQHSHSSHGSGHHHHHHHEQPRPVLVHVPTAQEPIDIHAHPFRWVGKATPAMRAARQSTSSSTNSSTHSLPLAHFEGGLGGGGGASAGHPMAGAGRQDRAKTIGVAEMSKPKHASGLSHSTVLSSSDEDLSRTAKRATSMSAAAAQVFKMPFKNRSSSVLSTTSSARNSIIEHTMPVSVSESNLADAKRDSAEVPSRGSLDLQRTLRPGQLDPAVPKSNLKRTKSPAPMTVAEEQDLQEYVEKSARSSLDKEAKYSETDSPIHGDSGRSSPTKATKEVRWEEDDSSSRSIREIMRRVDEQHQKRIRERKEREEDGSSSLPGSSRGSSRASSLNNASRSSSTERRRNVIRQPSNDEAVNERARVLREKGLLPTLSITTSEDADAVSPVTEHGPPGQEGNAMDAMLARGEVTSRSHVTEDQQDHK